MKYIKFTYVDSQTGISIAAEPAMNGTKFPAVPGLEFVWARESQYPAPVPQFFGTCPDDSPTQVDGVLGVFLQSDWEQMRADEMRSRVPQTITRAQAKLALLGAGLLSAVQPAIDAIPDSAMRDAMQIEWDERLTFDRYNPALNALASGLGMTETQIDTLFIEAAKL